MVALVVAGVWSTVWFNREPVEILLQKAELALIKKQYDVAETLASQVLKRDANSSSALVIAGDAAKELNEFDRAIAYYDRVPDDGSPAAVAARRNAGRVYLLNKKRLTLAEEQFRRCLLQDPDDIYANDGMAYAMGVSGQYLELIPHRLKLIRSGQISISSLYELSLGSKLLADPIDAVPYIEAAPDDTLELICQADIRLIEKDYAGAIDLAKKVASRFPELPKPHLTILNGLLQVNNLREFQSYHATLDSTQQDHPKVWMLRADYCLRCGYNREALRCYWESLRRDPNQHYASFQLSQLLISLDRGDEAAVFAKRADLLREYISIAQISRSSDESAIRMLDSFAEAARMAEELGMIWEAFGWYRIAAERNPANVMLAEKTIQLKSALATLPLQRSLAEFNPTHEIDLLNFPLPDLSIISLPDSVKSQFADVPRSVRFEEVSPELGIDFSYYSGRDPLTQRMLEMFEFNGGGVAVIDFDLDRWPDLYFTQGSDWPREPGQSDYLDALYRNGGGDHFRNVAPAAGIVENGYSQGATVGDFNGDGFPDLYIANIGENRLYENNGDGTFTDVTAAAGIDDQRWTTSCLIADLNGDTLPDLYDVNYLAGDDLFTRICLADDGVRHVCAPQAFPPEIDQLYLNQGDGTFENVSSASGLTDARGRGLGIVAFDLDHSGMLDLYVANDVGPNFFFWNQTGDDKSIPAFVEQATLMGFALNAAGDFESGMGIAYGDVDGDQLLDLFVTNFYSESNVLYRQQPGLLFDDVTRTSGLHDGSLSMVAFGTQFLDPDLDGHLDVVIANGHITGAHEYRNEPLQMRPQYFHNDGKGRYSEGTPASVGPYFARELLGRGLARLDWNRDGRDDFAVSHLDAPVALVTNTSSEFGNHIALRFVGIRSARDAIGTSITLTAGSQKRAHQLIAGDGFQASNERLMIVGCGQATVVDELEITWPSGETQKFASLATNEEYLILEGNDAPVLCRRTNPLTTTK
ncbi:MAG: FG-GAP-like repeat-containing protein [Planctomycetota bacterium]|nr:FG-GAP-like repeat-containing protein [Planctomycetota bacterium]MDA1212944.1 FG-GAP-like repeat-containing protein [Planctomycetota bacterium]